MMENEIKKADLSEPTKVDFGWQVNEQLYPENRGYKVHRFMTLKAAELFISNAKGG